MKSSRIAFSSISIALQLMRIWSLVIVHHWQNHWAQNNSNLTLRAIGARESRFHIQVAWIVQWASVKLIQTLSSRSLIQSKSREKEKFIFNQMILRFTISKIREANENSIHQLLLQNIKLYTCGILKHKAINRLNQAVHGCLKKVWIQKLACMTSIKRDLFQTWKHDKSE